MSTERQAEESLRTETPPIDEGGSSAARSVSEDGNAAPPGEAGLSARPSNTHLTSSHTVPPILAKSPETAGWLRMAAENMLLQSESYSGEIPPAPPIPNAVAAIDWLEESMLVSWDSSGNDELFFKLRELQESAKDQRSPEQYELAGQVLSVHPLGIGSGHQQRLEFRLDWPGTMLAFSRHGGKDRQHANLLLKISGEGCLLSGAMQTRQLVQRMIEELGGLVTDRWIRRVDLCLDLPDLSLEEWLIPAFEQHCFISSAHHWNSWDGKAGYSGFTIGNMKSVKLNVYDKLRHTQKQSEAYQLGMQLNRWGNRIPEAATRVEYQIRKAWTDAFGLTHSEQVLDCLPTILTRLTELERRPFFVMTEEKVDRKNKHQGRANRHPEWVRLVSTFRQLVGKPAAPLQRIDRGQLTCSKASQMILGYITTFAAQTGRLLETPIDALEAVHALFEINDVTPELIQEKLRKKALKFRTLREPESFEFGVNQPEGSHS